MHHEKKVMKSKTGLKKVLDLQPGYMNGFQDGVPSISDNYNRPDNIELIEIEGVTFVKFTDYCVLPLNEVAGIVKEGIQFEKALRAISEPEQPK